MFGFKGELRNLKKVTSMTASSVQQKKVFSFAGATIFDTAYFAAGTVCFGIQGIYEALAPKGNMLLMYGSTFVSMLFAAVTVASSLHILVKAIKEK